MNISLTWDLLVVVFFAVIIAYSFIVGKDECVKIVIATYIATIAVQGVGNLLLLLAPPVQTFLGVAGLAIDVNMVSIIKIVLFVALIIFLAIRGGFEMQYEHEVEGIWTTVWTAAFGISTAGLLLSSLLTYIAARPILDETIATSPSLAPLLLQSSLVQIMIQYQPLWFALPAFLLLTIGFLSNRKD